MPTWLGSRDPIRLQDVILANVVVKPPEIGRLKLSAEKQGYQRCCHLRRLKDESTWRTIITTSDNLVILRNRWKILKNFHHCHDNFISLSWHSKCENVPKVQARFFAEASPRHWHPCLEKHDRSCGLAARLLDHQKLQLNHQALTFHRIVVCYTLRGTSFTLGWWSRKCWPLEERLWIRHIDAESAAVYVTCPSTNISSTSLQLQNTCNHQRNHWSHDRYFHNVFISCGIDLVIFLKHCTDFSKHSIDDGHFVKKHVKRELATESVGQLAACLVGDCEPPDICFKGY